MHLTKNEISKRIREYEGKHNLTYVGELSLDYHNYCQMRSPNTRFKFQFSCNLGNHLENFAKPLSKFGTQGCPMCGKDSIATKQRKKEDDLKQMLLDAGFRLVSSYDNYENQHSIIEVQHIESGLKTTTKLNDFRRGRLKIFGRSQIEAEIKLIVGALFPNHLFHTRRPAWLSQGYKKTNLEIDLFNEDLGVAIEVDGDHHYTDQNNKYHKNEESLSALNDDDNFKDATFQKKFGHRIIRIREDQLNQLTLLKSSTTTFSYITKIHSILDRALHEPARKFMITPKEAWEPLKTLHLEIWKISPLVQEAVKLCEAKGYLFRKLLYVNNDKRAPIHAEYECTVGHVQHQNMGNLKNHGCNQCAIDARASKRRLSHPEVVERFRLAGWDIGPEEVKKYVKNSTYLNITCRSCGHNTKDSLAHVEDPARECGNCRKIRGEDSASKLRLPLQNVVQRYAENGWVVDPDDVANNYDNNRTKLPARCSACNAPRGTPLALSKAKAARCQFCKENKKEAGQSIDDAA